MTMFDFFSSFLSLVHSVFACVPCCTEDLEVHAITGTGGMGESLLYTVVRPGGTLRRSTVHERYPSREQDTCVVAGKTKLLKQRVPARIDDDTKAVKRDESEDSNFLRCVALEALQASRAVPGSDGPQTAAM